MCVFCRLVLSIYEAATIHSILGCRERGLDKTPLWFMIATAAVQLLMVSIFTFSQSVSKAVVFGDKHFSHTGGGGMVENIFYTNGGTNIFIWGDVFHLIFYTPLNEGVGLKILNSYYVQKFCFDFKGKGKVLSDQKKWGAKPPPPRK